MKKANETVKIIIQNGGKAEVVTADLCNIKQTQDLAEKVENIDALVLNASMQYRTPWAEITAVIADHTVEAFGLIVKAENKTLYFSGDTLYNENLFEIADFKLDITFICINGRLGNMNVNESLVTAKKIGAKVNIPNHYDMFESNSENPLLFSEKIEGGFVMEFDREYTVCENNNRIYSLQIL